MTRLLRRLVLLLALIPFLLASAAVAASDAPGPARSAPAAGAADGHATAAPVIYKLGAYIVTVHDLDPPSGTFQAQFWLWRVGPPNSRTIVDSLDFPNANQVAFGPEQVTVENGVEWRQVLVRGRFRHDWRVKNYPFDRQRLQIVIEDQLATASQLDYVGDGLSAADYMRKGVGGWKLDGTRLVTGVTRYPTAFGDPSLAASAGAQFSRVVLELSISRRGYARFFTLTVTIYTAFMLCMVSFLLHIDQAGLIGSRFSLLAASLFAVVLNMRAADSELGAETDLSLVDHLHVVCLAYIIAATAIGVVSKLAIDRGAAHHFFRRLDYWCCVLGALSFLLITTALVMRARING